MPTEQLKKLVAQLPDADRRGMLTENIDKEKIEKTVAEIYKGGRENFLGLIDLLGEPGSEANVKPHYAVRCVGNTLILHGRVYWRGGWRDRCCCCRCNGSSWGGYNRWK